MAGIYVHIPFCKSRCAYCDFYSTTRAELVEAYVVALCNEIALRRNEQLSEGVASEVAIQTVYFGGGTPSTLKRSQLSIILNCIYENYHVEPDAEVTLEMNPGDLDSLLSPSFFEGKTVSSNQASEEIGLRHVNRVSLGIQTFDDELLKLIRRRHDSSTALRTVEQLQAAGVDNISIDLIYGLPGQTIEQWQHDLKVAFSLGIQHLSAYALSYEPGTLLSRWRDEKRVHEADEELSVAMYSELCCRAREEGFEHYEISNFALPGYHSRHNSSYWQGTPYLGFGPSAHSYDGLRTRRANNPSLNEYIQYYSPLMHPSANATLANAPKGSTFNSQPLRNSPFNLESLTDSELFDEAVMCGLRTSQGIDLAMIEYRFGHDRLNSLLQAAGPHLAASRLILDRASSVQLSSSATHLRLAESAIMISDDIMSDLMS